jgi:uncharacterized membrane protein YbhN (UPF0104 family)
MNLPAIFRQKPVRILIAAVMTAASAWVMIRLVLVSKEQLANIPLSFQILPLVITVPLFLISTLLTSYIWAQMMSSFNGSRISNMQHIMIYLATQFAGRLPGGIWNVVGRVAWYEQLGIRKRMTTFVSIFQWFMILWSGTIVLLLVLPWIVGVNLRNFIILTVPILLIALLVNPRVVRALLKKILKDADLPSIQYRKILTWLILYLFIWALGGTTLYLITLSVYPGDRSWLYSLAAWSAAGVSGTLVTFLPSGLGVVELVTSLILTAQIPSSISVVVSLAMRVLFTVYEFVISLVFWVITRIKRFGPIPQD